MQNVKDVAYTVSRLLRKIDAKFPNKFELKHDEKLALNGILAEMISIQMQYMEVQNYPETRVQARSRHLDCIPVLCKVKTLNSAMLLMLCSRVQLDQKRCLL